MEKSRFDEPPKPPEPPVQDQPAAENTPEAEALVRAADVRKAGQELTATMQKFAQAIAGEIQSSNQVPIMQMAIDLQIQVAKLEALCVELLTGGVVDDAALARRITAHIQARINMFAAPRIAHAVRNGINGGHK